jgi:hypothetical protein
MEIERGFQLENPKIFIEWEATLDRLPVKEGLLKVTDEYYVMNGTALGGLALRVGLLLQHKRLVRIELLRQSEMDLANSYRDFQRRLEATFGPPDVTHSADGGYKCLEWNCGKAIVTHSVIERFSLEELVFISVVS